MARIKTWEISDEFWALVEPLIPQSPRIPGKKYKRKPGGGRKPKYSNRVYFSAIVYVLRTGIIWNALPREKFEGVGSAAVHRKFQQWAANGFFERLWRKGLAEYDEMEGIAWLWESAYGSNLKAPLGRDPTQRIGGKKGSKRSILVDENGVPLSLVVTGANRHDSVVLDSLLKARLLDPPVKKKQTQNLCLDAAYVGKENTVEKNGFVPHIRPRGEEKKLIEKDPDFKARRWVVELAHSWFNRFRKLVPRYEKTDLSYNALNALAAAMIVKQNHGYL